MIDDNPYIDLTTYNEIYQELVYQRNEAIRWLTDHALLDRNRFVEKSDVNEWKRHSIAVVYRPLFKRSILALFDRLYSHDAVEAIYDFNSVELNGWTETESNLFEREIQRLQLIIGKLETRYNLQYRLFFHYNESDCILYMSGQKVFACGQTTLRHRLLATIFSEPHKLWTNDDIEEIFIEKFNYSSGDLTDKAIEKAAKDIKKDVASATAVKDLLAVSNTSVRINSAYIN